MDTSNSFYLGLDQSLHILRVHFDMSRGATNVEVLEWAKYFLDWSDKAAHYCGPWSAENLELAGNFVRNLEKSTAGIVWLRGFGKGHGGGRLEPPPGGPGPAQATRFGKTTPSGQLVFPFCILFEREYIRLDVAP